MSPDAPAIRSANGLQSRVARRVFGLFLLSALAPVVTLALLTYYQISSTLNDQSAQQLLQLSKSYGMTVMQRLRFAEQQLGAAGGGRARTALTPEAAAELLSETFHAVALIAADGAARPLFGSSTTLRHRPAAESPRLWHADGGSGLRTVMALRRRDAAATSADGAVGELRGDFLWGTAEQLPPSSDVCVITDAGEVLFCSRPTLRTALRSAAARFSEHADSLSLEIDGQRFLIGYRQLNLTHYGHRGAVVVSFRERAEVFAPVSAFSLSFPAVTLTTLLAVALLSFRQVRSRLLPLATLTRAAQRFAARDADYRPVDVDGGDEFGELAGAFNDMAARILGQVRTLETLARIDRVVLDSPSSDDIGRAVVGNAAELFDYDAILFAIAAIDSRAPTVFWRSAGGAAGSVANADLRALFELPPRPLRAAQLAAAVDADALPCLHALRGDGVDYFHAFPIRARRETLGVVLLGYRFERVLDHDERSRADELTDRLAVALSASAQSYRLHHQAHHDALTGLPNRRLLGALLTRELQHARRYDDAVALLYIDLDRFKHVNDSAGHDIGDQLLIQAAARLRRLARSHDSAARLGGDEFNLILTRLRSTDQARAVAERAVAQLSEPFLIRGKEFYVSASIGVATFPTDADCSEELIRKSDVALYQAKRAGRGRVLFYRSEMDDAALSRADLERELRAAVRLRQFELHLQPQLDTDSGRIGGAEALIRWRHPTRGLIAPNAFIPLAEETGLIDIIGVWTLREACRLQTQWIDRGLGLKTIAVNVSSRQFQQPEFVELVKLALAETGLAPDRLELEITESLFIDNIEQTTRSLEQLHAAGVRLAIDDFGTGFSSLSYLSRFPVDVLKIDRAFLHGVPENGKATELIRSITVMSHRLDKDVVVEGVETAEQLAALTESGCDTIQGYHISRPLPVDEFCAFVERYHRSPRPARPRGGRATAAEYPG